MGSLAAGPLPARRAAAAAAAAALLAAVVLLAGPPTWRAGRELLSRLPALAPVTHLDHAGGARGMSVRAAATASGGLGLGLGLGRADQEAERKAQTAATWGTLAATKRVFRTKRFTNELQQMALNAQRSQSKAEKLEDRIAYEGKLLRMGRAGASSIAAQAALAARDASFVPDRTAFAPPRPPPSDGIYHNHEFVKVYPYSVSGGRAFRPAASGVQSLGQRFRPEPDAMDRAAAGKREFEHDEQGFLSKVQHEVRMKRLAVALKLGAKPKEDAGGDGILESRADMDNGVDGAATGAAAKRLAMASAAQATADAGASLAAPDARAGDRGVLDSRGDMRIGMEADDSAAAAARTLASSLVHQLKATQRPQKHAGTGAADAKPAAGALTPEQQRVVRERRAWSETHVADDAKVKELKRELWTAQEQAQKVTVLQKELWHAEGQETAGKGGGHRESGACVG